MSFKSILTAFSCGLFTVVVIAAAEKPPGLKDVYQPYFAMGAAIPSENLQPGALAILTGNFSIITPENLMKPKYLQPREGQFEFAAADRFVSFANSHHLAVHGHTLVWHQQVPAWIFKDGEKPAGRGRVLERVRNHVSAVVGHFKGQVGSWDVVNEALADCPEEADLRNSPWFRATGGDFIVEAFRAARQADPAAKLYYNDYHIERPAKRAKAIRLIRSLKAKNVPIDGIGIQGHWTLDQLDLKNIEASIVAFHAEGLRVSISELDMDVVPGKTGDPFAGGCPADVLQRQGAQYAGLFRLLRKHADKIDRVTFWGLDDGHSWINWFPRPRTNHPLLWARDLSPKSAWQEVMGAGDSDE